MMEMSTVDSGWIPGFPLFFVFRRSCTNPSVHARVATLRPFENYALVSRHRSGGVWLANHNKPTILRELGRNPAFFLTENDEICNLRSYPTSWNFWPKGPLREAKQGAKPAWREHVRNATATANMY